MERIVTFTCRVRDDGTNPERIANWTKYIVQDFADRDYGGVQVTACVSSMMTDGDDDDDDDDPGIQGIRGAYYAGRRAGTAHEEMPGYGATICAVCGDISDLSRDDIRARTWHGDSFDPVLWPPAGLVGS